MKKPLSVCLFLALLTCLLPPAHALERPTLHPDVIALCQKAYPEHSITTSDGFGNEAAGQWALVLTKEGQHVLVVVEKAKDEPAYRFTIENPTAFMPGNSHPRVMIDSAGDVLFIGFEKEEMFWHFDARKHAGAWGDVGLILSSPSATTDSQDEGPRKEWLMLVQDGQLFSQQLFTDQEDNINYRYSYPPIPVPRLAEKVHLSNYNWQDFPEAPILLVDSDGQPDPDVQAALTPGGWTLISTGINPGGIYVLGVDAQGQTRLLLKRWQHEPVTTTNSQGSFVDTLSAPLPAGVRLKTDIWGEGLSLYQDDQNRAFSFGWHQDKTWHLSFVMAQDWYAARLHYLYHPSSPDDTYYYGDFPFGDIRDIKLERIPGTFSEAKEILDQNGWAKVNNPNPKDRLHLRAKPNRNADSLGKFYNGTPVRVLERRGEWVKVQVAHLSGWMMRQYLAFGADANQVQPAFAQMMGLESLEGQEVPLYTRPDEKSPVTARRAIIYSQRYWIIGVVEEDWFFVYFYDDDIGGYILQKWFFEGNG